MLWIRFVRHCLSSLFSEKRFKCVLVKGWKASSNWGFPKGKINETEPPASCAIREVCLYLLFRMLNIFYLYFSGIGGNWI